MKLDLPISDIYERYTPPLLQVGMPKESREEKENIDFFSFRDPRLHHLNSSFSRDSLQVNLDFCDNPITLKNAFDDIIKLNCLINEFNYMNDLSKQMK